MELQGRNMCFSKSLTGTLNNSQGANKEYSNWATIVGS